jgi:hypothetical protein
MSKSETFQHKRCPKWAADAGLSAPVTRGGPD